MSTHVSNLLVELEKQRRELRAQSSLQVNSQRVRDRLRELAEIYFKEVRPAIEGDPRQAERIQKVDVEMQKLVEHCHRRGTTNSYLLLLKGIKKHLITVDTELVATTNGERQSDIAQAIDQRILITLRALLPSAAMSYEQALLDLASLDRMSWRGPAADLREALRETLDYLAPDKEVEESSGYRRAADTNGPTMKQKVRFILRSRGTARTTSAPSEDAAESIDSMVGQFVRSVYNRSSVSTHTATDRNEVLRILDFVRVVMCELLEVQR